MPREVYLNRERIRLDPTSLLGQGGEAEVFDLRGRVQSAVPLALKVWMPPDHPQFAASDADSERNRKAAASRIAEYGRKLREFPRNMPAEVVAPRELATDKSSEVKHVHRHYVVERFFGSWIREVKPLLQKVDPQHSLYRHLGASVIPLLVVAPIDDPQQFFPGQRLVHLFEKLLSFGRLLLRKVGLIRER